MAKAEGYAIGAIRLCLSLTRCLAKGRRLRASLVTTFMGWGNVYGDYAASRHVVSLCGRADAVVILRVIAFSMATYSSGIANVIAMFNSFFKRL